MSSEESSDEVDLDYDRFYVVEPCCTNMHLFMRKTIDILNQSLMLSVEHCNYYSGYMDNVSYVYGLVFRYVFDLLENNGYSIHTLDHLSYPNEEWDDHIKYLAVGLANNIVSFSHMFGYDARNICKFYLKRAIDFWMIQGNRCRMHQSSETRECSVPNFDGDGNLVFVNHNNMENN